MTAAAARARRRRAMAENATPCVPGASIEHLEHAGLIAADLNGRSGLQDVLEAMGLLPEPPRVPDVVHGSGSGVMHHQEKKTRLCVPCTHWAKTHEAPVAEAPPAEEPVAQPALVTRLRPPGWRPAVHSDTCPCHTCANKRSRHRAHERAREDPSIVPHGTTAGYDYYGCRCDACGDANHQAWLAEKERRREREKQRVAAKLTASGLVPPRPSLVPDLTDHKEKK